MIIFLFIILLLFFVPLPLKTSIYYCVENYYIKLYKYEILSKSKSLRKKGNVKKVNKNKNKPHNSIFMNKNLMLKLIYTISKNKFKPILKLNGTVSYALNNHEVTAISYGIISAIIPFIYQALGVTFKVKKFSLPVSPIFKELFYLKLRIEGIIFISLGQIIYMIFLILKTIINERVKRYD